MRPFCDTTKTCHELRTVKRGCPGLPTGLQKYTNLRNECNSAVHYDYQAWLLESADHRARRQLKSKNRGNKKGIAPERRRAHSEYAGQPVRIRPTNKSIPEATLQPAAADRCVSAVQILNRLSDSGTPKLLLRCDCLGAAFHSRTRVSTTDNRGEPDSRKRRPETPATRGTRSYRASPSSSPSCRPPPQACPLGSGPVGIM